MYLARTISLLRQAEGISQTEMSKRLGISRTYYSELESGRRHAGLPLLRSIAAEFDVPIAILFASEEQGEDVVSVELRKILTHLLDARSKDQPNADNAIKDPSNSNG